MAKPSHPSTAAPTLVAHRGASHQYPENTLIAYESAVAAGAKFVELDVQLSQDQVPILHHDQDLLRMTGRAGDITQLSAAKVLSHPAGYPERFGETFQHNRLVSLADFSQWMLQHPHVTTFVEIKRQSVEFFGAELVANQVLAAMEPIRDQCVVISFNEEVLAAVKSIRSSMPIGLVLRQYDDSHHQIAQNLRPSYLFCKTTRVPTSRTVWEGNWQWVLYNTETIDDVLDFYHSGFDMLETNRIVDLLGHAQLNANA
ncbi:glycerophosphodiester phosphodiesterase family protein [Planctomycetes bacterium K23_9]|uniref:Putative glycerophosphoryl diester phosphodiesterase 1 n=1 Tax=Stieleria marina TaxID=1930275 RepID=A0A517NQX5_9BACT|nr:putative glycerophosphoryl diester phosphodiesterase 1 [Planctomycetes bacterium K23_9]